jgi:hypothetical protein
LWTIILRGQGATWFIEALQYAYIELGTGEMRKLFGFAAEVAIEEEDPDADEESQRIAKLS